MNERVGLRGLPLWGGPLDFPPPLSIHLKLILTYLQVHYGGCLFLSVILNFIRATPSLVSPWAPCHKRFRLTNSIRFQHQKNSPGALITTRHQKTSFVVSIRTRHQRTFLDVLMTLHHKTHPSSCCKHKPPHS